MEVCNFKIGDVVAHKDDVERWAIGERHSHEAMGITSITENEKGFFCSNGFRSGMATYDIVPESEIKAHAIKHLASRMAIIAGA